MARIFAATAYVIGITIFLGFGYLVANGDWLSPPSSIPPNDNVREPINTGAMGQVKLGALQVNTGVNSPAGLFVYGNSVPSGCPASAGAGCVGIGTTNPDEKLDVVGNINISGVLGNQAIRGFIKPNGNFGGWSQTLTSTGPNSMDWKYDNAWMTIQRIDISPGPACFSFFPPCPLGWTEYSTTVFNPTCAQTPNWTYGNAIRICYQKMLW